MENKEKVGLILLIIGVNGISMNNIINDKAFMWLSFIPAIGGMLLLGLHKGD